MFNFIKCFNAFLLLFLLLLYIILFGSVPNLNSMCKFITRLTYLCDFCHTEKEKKNSFEKVYVWDYFIIRNIESFQNIYFHKATLPFELFEQNLN